MPPMEDSVLPYESLYHAFADLHAATATESDRDRRLHAFNDWLRDINRGLRGDLIVRFVRTEYSFGLDQRAFGCEDVAVKAIQDHLMKWVLDGYFFSCSNEPLYPKAYYHRSCKNAGKDAARNCGRCSAMHPCPHLRTHHFCHGPRNVKESSTTTTSATRWCSCAGMRGTARC